MLHTAVLHAIVYAHDKVNQGFTSGGESKWKKQSDL